MSTHDLDFNGWALVRADVGPANLAVLRDTLFRPGKAGARCLLDEPQVAEVAREISAQLVGKGVLGMRAIAVQALGFDKTPETNWKVTWHQDVMFPFAGVVRTPGYDLVTKKNGIDYARPPRDVLERMLAVRLHLDDCDEANGPLRMAPGSHRAGILKSTDITGAVVRHGEVPCLAAAGEALLMRPLLLHASSLARVPRHRRVLHLVYYSGERIPERWHREIGV
jgi:ectoine hydroxylase-related dioxygenase (phytanoyl-CoA dioxygenase family)